MALLGSSSVHARRATLSTHSSALPTPAVNVVRFKGAAAPCPAPSAGLPQEGAYHAPLTTTRAAAGDFNTYEV